MATSKNTVKIADKLIKVNDNFSVYRYDNGYGIEISGRGYNDDDDWTTVKLVCNNVDDLIVLIKEATTLPVD